MIVMCDCGETADGCINVNCVHGRPHEFGSIKLRIGNKGLTIDSKCKNDSYCVLIRGNCSCIPIGDEADIE